MSIGNGVKNISNWVFSGCTVLGSINCYAIVPPVVTSDTFGNMNKSIQLHIPAESLDLYKAADYWKNFINMVADLNSDQSSVSVDLAAELHAWQINGEVMVEYTQNIKVIIAVR